MIRYAVVSLLALLLLQNWHNKTKQLSLISDVPSEEVVGQQAFEEENDKKIIEEIVEERQNDFLPPLNDLVDEEARREDEEIEAPRATTIETLGNLKFKDAEEYLNADNIVVGTTLANYNGYWKLQGLHDEFFRKIVHKQYIPRLDQPITKLQFHEIFRQTSTPVIIPFETMKMYGFTSTGYTLEELREKFPYRPPADGSTPLVYNTRSGQKDGMDLGPAVFAVQQDIELQKAKGFKRNFPRNLKIKRQYLDQLGVSHPPFISRRRFQPPTLWFGTSTADTRLHSDCCDNFVQMIAGTKRWYIMPPTDSRHIQPVKCDGTHQSLCWAGVPYPNKELSLEEKLKLQSGNPIVIDLKAGEMLYLPAGWWHHIENLGPTIMVNFWTYGCENVGLALDLDPMRGDRPDFKHCPAIAQEEAQFLNS